MKKTRLRQGQTLYMPLYNKAGAFSDIEEECWTVHRVFITRVHGTTVSYTIEGTPYRAGQGWLKAVTTDTINKAMRHAQNCADGIETLWVDQVKADRLVQKAQDAQVLLEDKKFNWTLTFPKQAPTPDLNTTASYSMSADRSYVSKNAPEEPKAVDQQLAPLDMIEMNVTFDHDIYQAFGFGANKQKE